MRFIHTSDWHLGRMFCGINLLHEQAGVLEDFVRLVKDTKPDAVLIAGDIHDQASPSSDAIELLDHTLSPLLLDLRIPVIMIAGNHDSPERLGFANRLLARQGLHVAGRLNARPEPVVLSDQYGPVYFLPIPYMEPALVRDQLQQPQLGDHDRALRYLADRNAAGIPENSRAVVIAHCFLTGGQSSASERPLSTRGALSMVSPEVFSDFNYAALGHLHTPQTVGKESICYAGSLMKYSFVESHQEKGVQLVTLAEDGQTDLEWLPLTTRRNVRILSGRADDLLQGAAVDPSPDDYLMVVLRDDEVALDAVSRLRQLYPNILYVERPGRTDGESSPLIADPDRLKEERLFAQFFKKAAGRDLNQAEKTELSRVAADYIKESGGEGL